MDRTEADQIVINQCGKEIELATRRFAVGPNSLPLAWHIAEWLADCGFIRTSAEIKTAERQQDRS